MAGYVKNGVEKKFCASLNSIFWVLLVRTLSCGLPIANKIIKQFSYDSMGFCEGEMMISFVPISKTLV